MNLYLEFGEFIRENPPFAELPIIISEELLDAWTFLFFSSKVDLFPDRIDLLPQTIDLLPERKDYASFAG